MCHNSVLESEQIEKCIQNGMPDKIIKTIKHTMRKRAANEEIKEKAQEIMSYRRKTDNNSDDKVEQINSRDAMKESLVFESKCPFGHGAQNSAVATFFLAPLTTTTTMSSAVIDNKELYRFHKISQLNTTATDNDDNAITNLSGHFADDNEEKLLLARGKIYNDDILAKTTQLTRELVYKMQQAIKRLQSSKLYTLLTKTTQPAHLIAIVVVTFVLLIVWPELVDSSNKDGSTLQQQQPTNSVPRQENSFKGSGMWALIVYLGAFSTHFGAQIWMTFVSGLSLYFSLPRHMFGQCQQVLFPKYFAMNATLSITMLVLYVKFFIHTWTLAKCIQSGSLALTGAIELLVRLYLAPPMLRLMHEKYKIEGTIGSGKEIGSLVQGDLIKCPHYQRIHKAFRRIHMLVAIGNMITMAGSCLQLYNIAGQLQISVV